MNHHVDPTRMPVRSALAILADARDDQTIVITHQGSARVWPLIASHRLDFHYNPSTMGGATALGLGLAIARPQLHTVVVTGDGALTMNLGSLISIIAAGVPNLTVVVLDNGLYEVTGGQTTAASQANVEFESLAKSVGFRSTATFDNLIQWQAEVKTLLHRNGPHFVSLRVQAAMPEDMTTVNEPIADQLQRLRREIEQ